MFPIDTTNRSSRPSSQDTLLRPTSSAPGSVRFQTLRIPRQTRSLVCSGPKRVFSPRTLWVLRCRRFHRKMFFKIALHTPKTLWSVVVKSVERLPRILRQIGRRRRQNGKKHLNSRCALSQQEKIRLLCKDRLGRRSKWYKFALRRGRSRDRSQGKTVSTGSMHRTRRPPSFAVFVKESADRRWGRLKRDCVESRWQKKRSETSQSSVAGDCRAMGLLALAR